LASAEPSATAGLSASAETSAASGLLASAEVQAASGNPPHDEPEQGYLDAQSSFSAVNERGMYVLAEQDVNRQVPWSELLPQRGGECEEEGATSVADESVIESDDEDGPVGPSLKDHPYLSEPCTVTQLCTACFYLVYQERDNLCPACWCRDTLVHQQCLIAQKLYKCQIVNGNRIVGPKLRATLNTMTASRVLDRMEKSGVMAAGDIPKLHVHRLVGIHTEDNFIYSDVGASSASAGLPIAAVEGLMAEAPIDDTAVSPRAEEKVAEPAEEEEMADYGDHRSPIVGPDAASSPAAATIRGGKRYSMPRRASRRSLTWDPRSLMMDPSPCRPPLLSRS
jgi:hypothetical protein